MTSQQCIYLQVRYADLLQKQFQLYIFCMRILLFCHNPKSLLLMNPSLKTLFLRVGRVNRRVVQQIRLSRSCLFSFCLLSLRHCISVKTAHHHHVRIFRIGAILNRGTLPASRFLLLRQTKGIDPHKRVRHANTHGAAGCADVRRRDERSQKNAEGKNRENRRAFRVRCSITFEEHFYEVQSNRERNTAIVNAYLDRHRTLSKPFEIAYLHSYQKWRFNWGVIFSSFIFDTMQDKLGPEIPRTVRLPCYR